jgi:hypothetical protein
MFDAQLEFEGPEPCATFETQGEMAVAGECISLELTFLS